jgi:hypothetical protein
MKKTILLLLTLHGIFTRVLAQETIIQYLSGRDKDHTTPWEFFVSKGRNSGTWTSIPVPSLWDQQGFGNAAKSDEKGIYRYAFPSPKEWQNKKVFIVFEGVMTDAEVKLNGKPAGDVHQGGFSQFSFDISPLIRYEEPNLLEITVYKQSTNASINQAERRNDFSGSGGIYRPVYLKIVPNVYVERVAIDAKANGNLKMQVVSRNTQSNQSIELQVQDLQGKNIGDPIQVSAADNAEIKKQFTIFKTWNPELPHLYQAVVSIKDASQQVLHTYRQRFGFRTVESKSDGIYVNDTKVVFKGINRRNADVGLISTPEVYQAEINMMKDLNMNAVRLSYYPPDPEFLDLCDSLGLFVINEMSSGSQATYDAETGKKLVKELVLRDINHPSVIVWSYGNESSNHIDNEYRANDIQQRLVIHPVVKNEDSKKNSDFNNVANSILYGTDTYYPSEFSNGLYNGGRAAGLDDFWSEMIKQSKFSGGFLWSYLDEGNLDAGTSSEAIIKQRTEKGPSYYAIKEIWSPVVFDINTISSSFNGSLNVENRFLYTNLNKCRFDWKLVLYPKATQKTTNALTIGEGTAASPYTGPGEKGALKLNLPANWANADALLLSVYDARGKEICTWTLPIHQPTDIIRTIPEVASISTIMLTEDEAFLSLVCDGINYIFDKKNGNLTKVYCGKRDIPFLGPFIAGLDATMTDFKHTEKERVHNVEVTYKGDNYLWVKWTFRTGDLPKMEYQYSVKGTPVDYTGITFKYPEEKIVGMKWFGRGPWQVWKNRLKGQQLGVWEKSNRPGASGEPAKNAEFKGWHSEIYWVQFQTNMGNFTIYNDQSNVFLQLFNPLKQGGLVNEFNKPPFPENGNISFMHGISSIGTKFQPGDNQVSKSLKSANDETMGGTLWIDFRW